MRMEKAQYSRSVAKAIHDFLTEDEWHFTFDEETGRFEFGLNLECKLKKVSYLIKVTEDHYIVYARLFIGVETGDTERMARMAEFVCRANYGLYNGCFELDMDDGEIRYKCYVDCDEGAVPAKAIVGNSIYIPAVMLKRYGNGIADIIFSDVDAKTAVEKCEA